MRSMRSMHSMLHNAANYLLPSCTGNCSPSFRWSRGNGRAELPYVNENLQSLGLHLTLSSAACRFDCKYVYTVRSTAKGSISRDTLSTHILYPPIILPRIFSFLSLLFHGLSNSFWLPYSIRYICGPQCVLCTVYSVLMWCYLWSFCVYVCSSFSRFQPSRCLSSLLTNVPKGYPTAIPAIEASHITPDFFARSTSGTTGQRPTSL